MLVNSNTFNIQSAITDDWGGSHRVVLDLEALSTANNWEFEISLPDDYKIDQIYGAELTHEGGKTYISGVSWNESLDQGDNSEIVLIVDEGNSGSQAPIAPQFLFADFTNSVPINSNLNIVAELDEDGRIINVNNDFGGDLARAIASANDGDTVQLGQTRYYTSGITIDKDITINGQDGSVIDGGGTSEPIFSLTQEAAGATIQNLEITNGNNGIYGYNVFNLTLQNLDINNIGINQSIRDGQNNSGIVLNGADGLQLLDTYIHDIGRKGVGINDTDGAIVRGLTVQNINLGAQHTQSFDAAGIKFYNTNEVTISDSSFSDINAINIWNDTTNGTAIEGNFIKNVGEDFLATNFDSNVNITGIYNEKSSNSIVKNNEANAIDQFLAFNATEFSTETMTLIDNTFSSFAVNTQDYWVNESVEKLIATTEDPGQANFSLFADQYFSQANIG